MDELLTQQIATLLRLAQLRGVNPVKPVTLQLYPDSTSDKAFLVIVSFTEPTFSEIPYNCMWLNPHPSSPIYKKLMRRTSHVSDGAFRGSWQQLTTVDQMYEVDQVYRFVVENPSDLGLDVGDLTVPHATQRVMGIVKLKTAQADAVVVSASDPRLSDKRIPTEHDHSDYPRSKIKINAAQYAVVIGNSPEAGSVLALESVDPTDKNVYYARWVKATDSIVNWTSPRLTQVDISLPGSTSYMPHNSTMDLIGTGIWTDHTEVDPAGLSWAIEQNVVGVTIDANTGVVTAPALQYDTDLTVTVTLKDPVFGNTVTGTYLLRIRYIKEEVKLTSIEIVGATELLPKDQATYGIVGHYSDGTSAAITPDAFTANSAALTLSGYIATAATVTEDTVVTLTATKDSLIDTHQVTVRKMQPLLLTIEGAAVIDEHTTEAYAFVAHFNDGSSTQVTPATFVVDNAKATVNSNKVTSGEVVDDEAAKLTATYALNGVTVTAVKNITLHNLFNAVIPQQIVIAGPTTVTEKLTAQYAATVFYSDGSSAPLAVTPTWSCLVGTIDPVNGSYIAPTTTVDTPETISISAVVDGYTLTDTHAVMIKNVAEIIATKLVITGATTVNEGSSTQYQAEVYFSDDTVRGVNVGEMLEWSITGTSTASATGMVVAQAVTADTAATITLRAKIGEITLTDTLDILIKDVPVIPVSVTITGSSTVNENTVAQYTASITMSDGSTVTPSSVAWSISSGVGTIDASGSASWPKVMANSTSVVHVSATYGGVTLTKDKTVTIANLGNIVSVALLGAATIDEGKTASYTMRATNEDGSTTDFASPSLTFAVATSYATISGNVVTTKSVAADTAITLRGSVTAEGKTWTADLPVTIKNIPVTLSSLAISGPSSVQEKLTGQYSATATYSDGSTATVTPVWSISNAAGLTGLTVSAAGLLTTVEVTADTTIGVQASYTYLGVTKTATANVKITNVAAPTLKPRFGIVSRVNSEAGFNAAFLASLTTVLAGVTADNIYMPAYSSTTENNMWGYVALPKATHGYAYVRQVDGASYGFAGSWDGAKDYPDAWDYTGPAEVTIGGTVWVIYRHDFPFEQMDYTFEFKYNSSNPMSGFA